MNFDPEKFKKLLNSASNPSNPKDTKIKNYYVNQEYQEFVSFDIDFKILRVHPYRDAPINNQSHLSLSGILFLYLI